MNNGVNLIIEQLEDNKVIDVSSYFAQNPTLSLRDYLIASEFTKINPILERAQREVILDEELLDKNSDLKLQEYNQNKANLKNKIQITQDNEKTTSVGLETLLQTQNPIIVFVANQNTYSRAYGNQNQRGLNYRLSPNTYQRQFAWYDMSKQNIIPSYYKRH